MIDHACLTSWFRDRTGASWKTAQCMADIALAEAERKIGQCPADTSLFHFCIHHLPTCLSLISRWEPPIGKLESEVWDSVSSAMIREYGNDWPDGEFEQRCDKERKLAILNSIR